MEKHPITIIAENIASLKSIFGDIIGKNAELQKYMRQEGVIEEIKRVHKYAISPHSRGFYTKVNDPRPGNPGHRKTIIERTEEEIYIRLAEWYGLGREARKITPDDLYHTWMAYRKTLLTDPNTMRRDEQHYSRYLKDTAFFQLDVKKLTRADWKAFAAQIVSGSTVHDPIFQKLCPDAKKMTAHEWINVKSMLNGMLVLAMDNGILADNPLRLLKLEKGLFREVSHPKKEEQTYSDEEVEMLCTWCEERYAETKDPAYLYPPLSLQLGARIGEISTLKWSDMISEDGYSKIHVCREEIKNRTTNELSVAAHTKTHCERKVLLSSEAMRILKKLRDVSVTEWVFARDGKRLTSRQLVYVLEKYAKASGLPLKSSHKLRKTRGSQLYRAGLSPAQCAAQLGNSVGVFERHYLFDTSLDREILAAINSI